MSIAPIKPEGSIYPAVPSYAPTADDRTWGLLAHLSPFAGWLVEMAFLGPLIVWLIKKDQSPFVDDQAKEALNFQISIILAVLLCVVTIIGWLLLPVVAVGALILQIMAAVDANKGVYYRYPLNIRLIK